MTVSDMCKILSLHSVGFFGFMVSGPMGNPHVKHDVVVLYERIMVTRDTQSITGYHFQMGHLGKSSCRKVASVEVFWKLRWKK